MDTLLTSIRELKLGNRYFEHVFDAAYKLTRKYNDLKFVKVFLKKAKAYRGNQKGAAENL